MRRIRDVFRGEEGDAVTQVYGYGLVERRFIACALTIGGTIRRGLFEPPAFIAGFDDVAMMDKGTAVNLKIRSALVLLYCSL